MKSFVIHRKDGSVVGIATPFQDNAPAIVGAGDPDQIVTEVDLPADVVAALGAESEQQVTEMLQTLRIEGGLLVRGDGGGDGGKRAK
jgi:hypothetical protein